MKTRDFVFTIVGFLICWLFTLPLQKAYHERERATERDTIYDTIAVVKPIAKDSLIVRYKTIQIKRDFCEPIGEAATEITENVAISSDSVVIPITSKHYSDTLYDAWLSGYEPSLDSIKIYPPTIIERAALMPPHKRWHIGPSVGIAATPHGLQPAVGLTLTYSLISF